jgi:hypothetical protein
LLSFGVLIVITPFQFNQVKMMHLATYIMMPWLGGSAMAAPTPASGGPADLSTVSTGSQDPSNAGNVELIASLSNAATAVDRLSLLTENSDHVYDFLVGVHSNTQKIR